MRLRLRKLTLGLHERRLVRPGINREKGITFFYVSTVLEIAGGDLPADLSLYLDGFKRRARSDLIEVKGNVLLDYLRYIHRPRRRRSRGLLPADKGPEEQEQNDEGHDPSKNFDTFAAEAVFEMPNRLAGRDIDSSYCCHWN